MKPEKMILPKITKSKNQGVNKEFENFPVDHYSYSMMDKFSSNPIMFKIGYINNDKIETTSRPSNIIGRAAHHALKTYYRRANETKKAKSEGEAIKMALEDGAEYLKSISDVFIDYDTTVTCREKLNDKFSFAINGFIKDATGLQDIKEILLVEERLKYKMKVNGVELPIPIEGVMDLVYRDNEGRIIVWDHKFTSRFSPDEDIDGAKLLQAAMYYGLISAHFNEAPYSMIFGEFKTAENRDKEASQVKLYEIVYSEHSEIFDFFLRFYEDFTAGLMGKQVYIPNLHALFDKDVAIIAYINRLDIDTEREAQFKEFKVDNITDLIHKKLASSNATKKYLDTVAKKFISTSMLNYKAMTNEERIKTKLLEHGISVEFDSKVQGNSVTLYRYEPSVGLKMSRLNSYAKDIEQVVEVSGVRILAPIPNSSLVGFEVPNQDRTFPTEKPEFKEFDLAIGVDVMGDEYRYDLRQAPHMIVAGSTGSGKSVFISSLINQLQLLPQHQAQLYLLDPKMVELAIFRKSPNTAVYESENAKIIYQLKHLIDIMDYRYTLLQEAGVKNLEEYNLKADNIMPFIFCFIDEFGDLVSRDGTGKQAHEAILILAQKARAAGIHLILTTQRPSIKIVSGDIKANFPVRVAFRTATAIDSHVILDQEGAEKLLGKGDMLFLNPQQNGLNRLQGYNL